MFIPENVGVISQEYVQMVDSFENFNFNCMYVFTLVIDFIQCFTFCLFVQKYGWYKGTETNLGRYQH